VILPNWFYVQFLS